jgi:3-oxoacyl-(acyl-carrier-protein) synthase/thioesterase domain-containing protein/acyl carrier protein
MTIENLTGIEIAIIGMDCKFPGANSGEEFWQNLTTGNPGISFLSNEQILMNDVNPEEFNSSKYVNAAGVISDYDQFDASFFGYSKRDAIILNPTHRLLLMSCYSALENAGYAADVCGKQTGVYAALSQNNYLQDNLLANKSVNNVDLYRMQIFNSSDQLAGLVAYNLNLQGPAVNIQAACASSLVAVHMACQGLLGGDCSIALAGAVTCRVPQQQGYEYYPGMNLSKDGYLYSFDHRASGTVPGSGVGTVVLKRLEDAIADNDVIYAVIKGMAVNNDGNIKMNYTAPNGSAQNEVIHKALHLANINVNDISYIEGHGSGTQIGDEIELTTLKDIFDKQDKKGLNLGSIKSSVGHLDAAAGMAGLIKVALMLKHKQIPPQIHFSHHPLLDNSLIKINTTLSDWKPVGMTRTAGINSMGIGGTNVHAILTEVNVADSIVNEEINVTHLFCLSAKTATALAKMKNNLENYFKINNTALAHVANTLLTGRNIYDHLAVYIKRQRVNQLELVDNIHLQQIDNTYLHIHYSGRYTQEFISIVTNLYGNDSEFKQIVDALFKLLPIEMYLPLKSYATKQTTAIDPKLLNIAAAIFQYAIAKYCLLNHVKVSSLSAEGDTESIALFLAGSISAEDFIQILLLSKNIEKTPASDYQITINQPSLPLESVLIGQTISLKNLIAHFETHLNTPSANIRTGVIFEIGNWQSSASEEGPGHLPKRQFIKLAGQHALTTQWLAAQFWLYKIRFSASNKNFKRIALPSYPFDLQSYWEVPHQDNPDSAQPAIANIESLTAIWVKLLGNESFTEQDDFYDLGGDSLLAAQLIAHLNQTLEINLDYSWVENHPSLHLQHQYLLTNAVKAKATSSTQLITKLNDARPTAPILFLAHPGMGDGKIYQGLAGQLEGCIQVYGIDSFNKKSADAITSLSELATLYISLIKEVQPLGPYYLGGWSLGGTIALEMANQLLDNGDTVSRLYLLDSYCFDSHAISLYEKIPSLFYRLHLIVDNKMDASEEEKRRLLRLLQVETNLLKYYPYKKYSGHCMLFHAERMFELPIQKNPTEEMILGELNCYLNSLVNNGWQDYLPHLKVAKLPVDHNRVLSNSALPTIKAVIEQDMATGKYPIIDRVNTRY